MVDEQEDDWAPLTAEQLAQRPGEVDRPVTAAEQMPWPVEGPVEQALKKSVDSVARQEQPESRPEKPLSPRAEKLVRDLQERVAKAGPGTSLIAEMQRREQRTARQQSAARKAQQGLAESLVVGVVSRQVEAAESVASAPELEPELGRDEREDSEWYRQLPQVEQDRLREVWAGKREVTSSNNAAQKRSGNRRMMFAWGSFLGVVLLGSGALWHATLGAGVVCGFWWRHAPPDRFSDPLRGFLCLLGVQGMAMAVQDASNPSMMMDAVLVVAFGALVGFDGEIRRSGGFDVAG